MREIKFRGKRVDNGEWVYGYYVKDPKGLPRIYWQPFDEANSNTYHFVRSETVGQYTGLKDKSGKEIFEGHCLGHKCNVVEYLEGGFCVNGDRPLSWLCRDHEIIGNIHDTPSILSPKPL